MRKTYYAMCVETDYLLGRVYNLAEATGHLKNTYTVFVSGTCVVQPTRVVLSPKMIDPIDAGKIPRLQKTMER